MITNLLLYSDLMYLATFFEVKLNHKTMSDRINWDSQHARLLERFPDASDAVRQNALESTNGDVERAMQALERAVEPSRAASSAHREPRASSYSQGSLYPTSERVALSSMQQDQQRQSSAEYRSTNTQQHHAHRSYAPASNLIDSQSHYPQEGDVPSPHPTIYNGLPQPPEQHNFGPGAQYTNRRSGSQQQAYPPAPMAGTTPHVNRLHPDLAHNDLANLNYRQHQYDNPVQFQQWQESELRRVRQYDNEIRQGFNDILNRGFDQSHHYLPPGWR